MKQVIASRRFLLIFAYVLSVAMFGLAIEYTKIEFGVETSTEAAATPGGSDGQVQFNDGGSFGGDSGFTFNKTTNAATLGSTLTVGNNQIVLGQNSIDTSVPLTVSNTISATSLISTTGNIEAGVDLASAGSLRTSNTVSIGSAADVTRDVYALHVASLTSRGVLVDAPTSIVTTNSPTGDGLWLLNALPGFWTRGIRHSISGNYVYMELQPSTNFIIENNAGQTYFQIANYDVSLNGAGQPLFDFNILGDLSSHNIVNCDADALTSGGFKAPAVSGALVPESQADLTGSVGLGGTVDVAIDITISANNWYGKHATYVCDSSAAEVHVVLPDADTVDRRLIVIKKANAGGGDVDVDGNGTQTIDGATSFDMTTQYQSIGIQSHGGNWIVLWEFDGTI